MVPIFIPPLWTQPAAASADVATSEAVDTEQGQRGKRRQGDSAVASTVSTPT